MLRSLYQLNVVDCERFCQIIFIVNVDKVCCALLHCRFIISWWLICGSWLAPTQQWLSDRYRSENLCYLGNVLQGCLAGTGTIAPVNQPWKIWVSRSVPSHNKSRQSADLAHYPWDIHRITPPLIGWAHTKNDPNHWVEIERHTLEYWHMNWYEKDCGPKFPHSQSSPFYDMYTDLLRCK